MNRMKYNRIQDMELYLQSVKSATNKELMEHFDISMQTLRRDLKELEDRKFLKKIYGGVVICEDQLQQNSILDINSRKITNIDSKIKIGRLAATLVEDGDIIFVDSGTTAFHLIPFLTSVKNVTIVSHSLLVMFAISELTNVTSICLGGIYNPTTWTFDADTSFNQYNYNKAFISTVGISINKGLTNTDYKEGVMKRHVIENSNQTFILADASKMGNVAFNHFADLFDIDAIITDTKPEEKFLKFFKKLEIKVIYK